MTSFAFERQYMFMSELSEKYRKLGSSSMQGFNLYRTATNNWRSRSCWLDFCPNHYQSKSMTHCQQYFLNCFHAACHQMTWTKTIKPRVSKEQPNCRNSSSHLSLFISTSLSSHSSGYHRFCRFSLIHHLVSHSLILLIFHLYLLPHTINISCLSLYFCSFSSKHGCQQLVGFCCELLCPTPLFQCHPVGTLPCQLLLKSVSEISAFTLGLFSSAYYCNGQNEKLKKNTGTVNVLEPWSDIELQHWLYCSLLIIRGK